MSKNEVGSFILRVALGIIFLSHGIAKFQGGIENTVGWFTSIGLPGFLAYAVVLLEVVGGIALMIGLGTKILSLLFSLLLIGAIFKVKLSMGFIDGFAYDFALLAIAVYLVFNGSRFISVDQYLVKTMNNNSANTKVAS